MSVIQGIIGQLTSPGFANDPYLQETRSEFLSSKVPAKPVYIYETSNKVRRIALEIIFTILAVVLFPYGLYRLLHWIGGKMIVPAQNDEMAGKFREKFYEALQGKSDAKMSITKHNHTWSFIPHEAIRRNQNEAREQDSTLVAKRISILVDGRKIDATILGERRNLANRKWAVFTNGNGASFETMVAMFSDDVVDHIHELGVNYLFFNYSGVGASGGFLTRCSLITTQRAMIRFLEDKEKGIGAEEILQIGTSLGGGIQGEAMKRYRRNDSSRHVLVKYQTFSKISKVTNSGFSRFLIKFFGWSLASTASSLSLEEQGIPEIIIQKAAKLNPDHPDDIEDDDRIPVKATHARKLLKKEWTHKKFIGTTQWHYDPPVEQYERDEIFRAIRYAFQPSYSGFGTFA